MQLPLADEIRDARRLADASHAAVMHISQIDAALLALSLIERQLDDRPDIDIELPGDDVVESLVERWSELEDLSASGPRPTQDFATRLRLRQQQLQSARQFLEPLGAELEPRAAALDELQHRQRHHLEKPEFAQIREELGQLHVERSQLAARVAPMNQRIVMYRSGTTLLNNFVGRIETSLAADEAVTAAVRAWRALTLAHHLVDTMRSVLGDLALPLALPHTPVLPDTPDEVPDEQMLDTVRRVLTQFVELRDALASERDRLERDFDETRTRYEAVTQTIHDRMG